MNIAAGLDREAYCGVNLAVGILDFFQVFEEGRFAVYINGRLDLRGYRIDLEVFSE